MLRRKRAQNGHFQVRIGQRVKGLYMFFKFILGCYNKFYEPGTYVCVVCAQPLFSSDTKYDSGCGWPAFNDVLDKGKVKLSPDTSGGNIFEFNCLTMESDNLFLPSAIMTHFQKISTPHHFNNYSVSYLQQY